MNIVLFNGKKLPLMFNGVFRRIFYNGVEYNNEPPVPALPVMTISVNQSFTLSALTGSVNVSGVAASELNLIYLWERISGSGTIADPASPGTSISGISQGSSVFRLTVTDELGRSVSMTTQITANLPDAPVAGSNTTGSFTLGALTNPSAAAQTLNGSGVSGTGITYSWARTGGTGTASGLTISNATAASPTVYGMGCANSGSASAAAGTHIFTLTVTDIWGRTATKTHTISANLPAAPTADAGIAVSIYLPTSSISRTGAGTGTGITYSWSRVSGSGTASPTNTAATTISGLTAGNSTYTLTVKDLWGRTATSSFTVTVNAAVSYGSKEFTSNDTFTVPAGIIQLRITACAAGGKGYKGNSNSTVTNKQGKGGGGGAAIKDNIYSVTPGQSISLTVGSGNTIIGNLLTLTKGGDATADSPGKAGGPSGLCGGGDGGDYQENGKSGISNGGIAGSVPGNTKGPGGGGGSLGVGGDGGNDQMNSGTSGKDGAKGSGGGGAPAYNNITVGNGGPGYVLFEWGF